MAFTNLQILSLLKLVLVLCFFDTSNAKDLPKGFALYCKEKNCYDLLGVSPTAELGEIKKAYRRLSLQNHPDKNDAPDATEKFMEIATAYEILSSEDVRKAYDDFLAHPERHVWQHYSNYYQAYYTPKSDLRLVFFGMLLVASIVQYASANFKRNRAVRAVLDHTKTRLFMKQRVYELGGKSLNPRNKEQLAALNKLEAQAEQEVLEKTMINGVRLSEKISWDEILLGRVLLLPLDTLHWVMRHGRWFVLFTLLRREYGAEEKVEVTRTLVRKALGIDWDALSPEDQQELVDKELWHKENLDALVQEEAAHAEEDRRKAAQTGRYKAYRRWAKRNAQ